MSHVSPVSPQNESIDNLSTHTACNCSSCSTDTCNTLDEEKSQYHYHKTKRQPNGHYPCMSVSTTYCNTTTDIPVQNAIAENFGGPASKLGTRQFELTECPDLSEKVAVVTGGSQGIGFAVVHTLLKNNIAKVYVISTSEEVINGARESIRKDLGDDAVSRLIWKQCDLTDWAAVYRLADQIKSDTNRLDILVNNAGRGVMTAQLTDYGVDRHMALNHFAHVILTTQLLDLMKKTAAEGHVVRISNQSSNLHNAAPSDTKFASLEEINKDVGPNGQYGRSKLAGILWTRYFTRKVTERGHPNILMNATHPGMVSTKQSVKDVHEP